MDQTTSLMSAKIHFIPDRLSLIHIPLSAYSHFVQAILKLLFPIQRVATEDEALEGHELKPIDNRWPNEQYFLNFSLTPLECSIVCSASLAARYFAPIIAELARSHPREEVADISVDEYIAISVEGEGLEAGQRVLELTTPLALAGISIFFITTYFSDYILVPYRARPTVIRALEDRGFVFEAAAEAFVSISAHHRNSSSVSSLASSAAVRDSPDTPPPSSIIELQARTFDVLQRHAIVPEVHRSTRLIQCAGSGNKESIQHLIMTLGLVKCIATPPRFVSLTLTDSEAWSLLLEKDSLLHFGEGVGGGHVLLGNKEACLIPITLDLRALPLESTGIVCGVASKLVGDKKGQAGRSVEMSYLSTARAGTMMVDEADLATAVDALNKGDGGFDIA